MPFVILERINPFSMPLNHMKYHEETIDDNNKDNNKNS